MNDTAVPLRDRDAAQEALEKFILGGIYAAQQVPSNIDPAFAEQFIRTRVDRSRAPNAFNQARRVADYYALRKVTGHFRQMLDRTETDTRAVLQSCRCVSILAEQGEPDTVTFAHEYFTYLVSHRLASEAYELLIETLESLGPEADSQPLANRMAREMTALEPRIAEDRQADNDYQELDQLLNNQLPAAIEIRQERFRILNEPQAPRRIDQLCRLYAEWEFDGTPESAWWSARHLRREAGAGFREGVISSFNTIVAEIDASEMPKEDRVFHKVRALRAIRFLGGQLAESQQRYLSRAPADQLDILHRDL